MEAVCEAPQLLKLGIALEFRDALNKTAIQLLKNLDRSKCSITVCPITALPFVPAISMFRTTAAGAEHVKNCSRDINEETTSATISVGMSNSE